MNKEDALTQVIIKATKDDEFRRQLINEPIKTIEGETGIPVPQGFKIIVTEDKQDTMHLNIPYIESASDYTDDDILEILGPPHPSMTYATKTYKQKSKAL